MGGPEDGGVLGDLRGLPTELRDLCLGYVLYRYQAEGAGLRLYHPEMFSPPMRWNQFDTRDANIYTWFTEEAKAVGCQTGWATVRAAGCVSSSERASGTVTVLGVAGRVCAGIILNRGQRNMNKSMWSSALGSGTSWFYDEDGLICKCVNGVETMLQPHLQGINVGDEVTVLVNDGWLSFEVNGEVQGTPVALPEDVEVVMAVSLWSGEKVRFD